MMMDGVVLDHPGVIIIIWLLGGEQRERTAGPPSVLVSLFSLSSLSPNKN
jgi:hypothetical protein